MNPRMHLTRATGSRTRRLAGGLFAGSLLLAACGADTPIAAPAGDAPEPAAADAPAAEVGGVAATIATTSLGDVLVGADGRTLYGFTNDSDASSTCSGTCADAWPPVIVDPDFAVAPALDVGIFATTVREDGSHQLVAGKWPLYFFAGDAIPGDVNGQGSGDVWFAVTPDGSLITDAPAAPEAADAPAPAATALVSTGTTSLGDVLVDASGLSLYGFTEDVDGVPTCADACADAWPPVLLDSAELPADLDPAVFSVSERADGTFQLNAGVWPLYRFAGDAAPGDVNGQNSGDVWFLATPDGGLIRDGADEASAPAEAETDVEPVVEGY